MKCEEVQARLSEYIETLLDPESTRTLEGHLSSCPLCSGEAEALSDSIRSVANLPRVEPPIGFSQKVMAHVREEAEKPSLWQRLFLPIRIKVPIHASAMVLIGGLAVYLYQTSRPHKTEMASSVPPISEPTARKDLRPATPPLAFSDRKNKGADDIVLGGLEKSGVSSREEVRSLGLRAQREMKESDLTVHTELVLVLQGLREGTRRLEQELDGIVKRVRGEYVQPEQEKKTLEHGRLLKRQTLWVKIPEDQYKRFRSELAFLGKIVSERSPHSLEPQASRDAPESLRIKVIILPSER
jgi:hypothetical protein